MKIIKALRVLSLPIQGLAPGRYVMKNTYQQGDVIAVHEKTLKTLAEGSYKLWSEDEGDFIETKKNEEKELDTDLGNQEPSEEETELESEEEETEA